MWYSWLLFKSCLSWIWSVRLVCIRLASNGADSVYAPRTCVTSDNFTVPRIAFQIMSKYCKKLIIQMSCWVRTMIKGVLEWLEIAWKWSWHVYIDVSWYQYDNSIGLVSSNCVNYHLFVEQIVPHPNLLWTHFICSFPFRHSANHSIQACGHYSDALSTLAPVLWQKSQQKNDIIRKIYPIPLQE